MPMGRSIMYSLAIKRAQSVNLQRIMYLLETMQDMPLLRAQKMYALVAQRVQKSQLLLAMYSWAVMLANTVGAAAMCLLGTRRV